VRALHHLLLGSANTSPDSLAYIKGETRTTYAALATGAARTAGLLREGGIAPGDRVALVLDGCLEYLVAYYGILMAGGVVVPLSPDTRAGILIRFLNHSHARAAVVAGNAMIHLAKAERELANLSLAIVVGPSNAELQRIPSVDLTSARDASPDEHPGGSASDLACINYTSGTTGDPKGVMLTHRNLVANTQSIVEYLGLGADDRVAMVLPYYYVYGNSVLHTHLAVGGTVVDAGSMAYPVRVLEEIQRHRCTGISGVPSTFARLLRAGSLDRFDLSSLRYLTQAGAAMTRALTSELRRALPWVNVFVMYGQTEASARLSYLPPEDLERKAGSVGIAIPGVRLRVVDSEGLEVPRGTVGEIVAEGDNVMLGYLDDPEATAEALRGGVLHTSDMGHMDTDGFLYITGRRSEMIKTGGHRVGPHEVEEVIAAIEGIAACAVVGVAHELLGQEIVAMVVLADGARLDERTIKKRCFAELPRYKMPGRVLFADQLPRSDRGKVLRSVVRDRLENEVAERRS
jgi:acyl-CoA synthetase (AMP-forming)/AMP-acid ligase II